MEISQLVPPSMLGDSALLAALDGVNAALSTLITYRLYLTADLDSRGLAGEQGARDTVEFLALRHHRNPRDVRRDLKTALALPAYTAVTAALPNPQATATATAAAAAAVDDLPDTAAIDPDPADADAQAQAQAAPDPVVLTPGQAEAIVTTLEKAPPSVPDEQLRVAEEQMIEAARLLCPDDLLDFGREVLARLDTDGPEPAEDDAHAKETLRLRRADGGVKFSGYLAGDHAELLQTQINQLSRPHRTVDGDLDPRPRDKRQADALTLILNAAAGNTPRTQGDSGEPGTSNGSNGPNGQGGPGVPHITITIDLDDLRNATSQAVGEFVYGDNLSATAVRRLACDAAVLPIVLGSDSQPLDVGTEHRFVTRHIRRALTKRDKGCVICKAPPWQCHAHHLIHWIDGGPTAITNLVLLCAGHHRAVHAGHWTITITHGVVEVTRPTWTTPGTTSPTDLANLTDLSRYYTPPPTGQVNANPHHHPDQLSTTLTGQHSPHPKPQPGTRSLSWLTPQAVALLERQRHPLRRPVEPGARRRLPSRRRETPAIPSAHRPQSGATASPQRPPTPVRRR